MSKMDEVKKRMPFTIAIDVDNTINDYTIKALKYYNQKYDDNVQYDSILKYDLQSYLKPECKDIYKEFEASDDSVHLELFTECKTALAILKERYSIIFVTAAPEASLVLKKRWLMAKLDWDEEPTLIRCVDRPSLKMIDVLIDDCLDNLYGPYDGIIYAQPWNLLRDTDYYGEMLRTNNWSAIIAECKWLYKEKFFFELEQED